MFEVVDVLCLTCVELFIDRYGWTWFTQKQSETEKKLIELEKRIEDLENK